MREYLEDRSVSCDRNPKNPARSLGVDYRDRQKLFRYFHCDYHVAQAVPHRHEHRYMYFIHSVAGIPRAEHDTASEADKLTNGQEA
jgi:hypothetical protein